MSPSPIRAIRTPESAEPDQVYLWTFPGSPVRVRLPLTVVSRLEQACLACSDPASPPIHGILIGSIPRAGNGQHVIEISDYRMLPSHTGQYTADEDSLQRLRADVIRERSQAGHPLRVLGYWRVVESEAPQWLRDDEAAWVNRSFAQPQHIVLSIHTKAGRSPMATFFIRNKDGFLPFWVPEFPLEPDKLLELIHASEESITLPPTPRTSVARASVPLQHWRTWFEGRTWFAGRTWFEGRTASLTYLGIGVAAVLGAAAVMLRTPSKNEPVTKPALSETVVRKPAGEATGSPLALRAEASGTGLQLQWWLPPSAASEKVRSGNLIIREQGLPDRRLSLRPEQLRQGKVFYQPSSSQVQFLLEVTLDNQVVVHSSVLAQAPDLHAAAPRLPNEPQPAPVPQPPQSPVKARQQNNSATSRPTQPERPAEQATSIDVAQAPRLSQMAVPAPTAMNQWLQNSLPPDPRPPVAADPLHSPQTPSSTVLDRYRPPVPLQETPVQLDKLLWPLVVREIPIELRVHIDKSGRVVRSEPVQPRQSGVAGRLTALAQETVLRWRFVPAHIGDEAVEADHNVRFVFRPRTTPER